MEKKHGTLIESFKYAFDGLIYAFKKERNMHIHLCATCLVIFLGFIFEITKIEWILCLIAIALVMSSELVNTAFEKLADVCEPKENAKIKICKDVAAGAVLINALIAAIVGCIIFIPYIFQ